MTKRKTKPASPARTKLEELKTEHDRDLAALAAAKAIEASIIKKCVSVQLDEKTTIIAHADHVTAWSKGARLTSQTVRCSASATTELKATVEIRQRISCE